jgi:hypothetical protein
LKGKEDSVPAHGRKEKEGNQRQRQEREENAQKESEVNTAEQRKQQGLGDKEERCRNQGFIE